MKHFPYPWSMGHIQSSCMLFHLLQHRRRTEILWFTRSVPTWSKRLYLQCFEPQKEFSSFLNISNKTQQKVADFWSSANTWPHRRWIPTDNLVWWVQKVHQFDRICPIRVPQTGFRETSSIFNVGFMSTWSVKFLNDQHWVPSSPTNHSALLYTWEFFLTVATYKLL